MLANLLLYAAHYLLLTRLAVAKDGLANRSRLLALPKGIETMSSDAVISVSEECNALRQSPEEPLSMMHGARRGMPSNNSRPGTKTMATGGLANDATASIHCEASLHDKSEDSVAMVGSQFPSQATLRPNEILTGSKARQLKKLEPVFITARSNSKTLRTYLSDDSDERKYRMSRGKLA